MLIWIDGTFGVGKTTIAELLCERLSSVYKAEVIESDYYFEEMAKQSPILAFGGITPQDNPNFISFFRGVLDNKRFCDNMIIIVPMALTCPASKEGLYDYYKENESLFLHFVLSADEETIRSRIINDDSRDKQMALTFLSSNIEFLNESYPSAEFIDTTKRCKNDIVEHIKKCALILLKADI